MLISKNPNPSLSEFKNLMTLTDQRRAVNKLRRLKVGALFMEMGTGKTKVALDLKALDAARLSAQREWEAAHPAEMAEADRLYRQERERVLAANTHDHFLAEQDRKEGY